jgi:ribosome biogenesis GTPase / thiamine phosphate phosphatase
MKLKELGWNKKFAKEFEPYRKLGFKPARIIRDNKISYGALLEGGEEYEVIMSGKLYHDASNDAELPAVGDWVALDFVGDEVVIRARLKRQTCFSRKVPGKSSEEQVMAANVDIVVIVTDAGADFNLRRLERYFLLIDKSRAKAVVLINKCDLFPSGQNLEAVEQIRSIKQDVDVHLTSAKNEEGLECIRSYLKPGVSLTLVGSSGVGKSTLVNQLLGEDWQWTCEVNEVTGKGRHTTTARELIIFEQGGILIDNPGIREVQMWTDENTLREAFWDVELLAKQCKFHDCKHRSDEACAIRAAVERGDLELERYENFLKLDEEIEKLKYRKKRRQMNVERRAKRDHRVKARNLSDRIEIEKHERPDANNDYH